MPQKKHPKVIVKKLGKERAWGQYHEADNVIEFDSRLVGKKKLEVYIHERTHAHFKDMSEEDVTKFASVMADFLWKNHVRFVDNTPNKPKEA
jgi:hypothetical protein